MHFGPWNMVKFWNKLFTVAWRFRLCYSATRRMRPRFHFRLNVQFFTFFEFSRKNHLINSKEQVQKVTFITKTGIFTDKFTDKSLINLLYYGSTRLSSSIQNGDYWLVQEHSRLVLERQCNCCERHLLREIDVILPAAPTAWLIG